MKNCERLDGTTKPVSTACTEFKTPSRAVVTSTTGPSCTVQALGKTILDISRISSTETDHAV